MTTSEMTEPAGIEVDYSEGTPTFTLRRNISRDSCGDWKYESVTFSAQLDPLYVAADFDALFECYKEDSEGGMD